MCRLICTFVVSICHKTHFRMTWPKYLFFCPYPTDPLKIALSDPKNKFMIWKWEFFLLTKFIICCIHKGSFLYYFVIFECISIVKFKTETTCILKHSKEIQLVLISFLYFGIHFPSFRKKKKKIFQWPTHLILVRWGETKIILMLAYILKV